MKVFTKVLSVMMVFLLSSALVFGQSTNLEKLKVSAAQSVADEVIPGVIPAVKATSEVTKVNYAKSNSAKSELWNSGPFVTHPGGGFGGADVSALQTDLLMNTLGGNFNHAYSVGEFYYMGDDFTVTDTWTVNSMKFFGYQTGSTTTSTFTGVYVQIWDGDPSAGGTVVFGDLTTNRLASTTFSGCYRAAITAITDSQRPIMEIVADMSGCELTAGEYWVQVGATGSLASGPWSNPINILGETTTGNAKQKTTAGAAGWVNWEDTGTLTGLGLPFIIEGTSGGASTAVFEDNFDSYTSGGQLACQNPTAWTTWSNAPCGSEDAYISSLYAYSGSNSAVIAQNNDLVKDFGDPYTSGKYSINFWAYIPSTKAGYFNTLQSFAGASSIWGLEVYFNAGGAGSINANGTGTATFTWTPDVWFKVEHIIDMDMDLSEIWIDGVMLYSYQWSLGATGTGQNTLDANDFFGATANDQLYIDDYKLEEVAGTFGDPPTDLTATATGDDVHLDWDAPGGGSTSDFVEDFESGTLPTGWLAIDDDNDGYNWENTAAQGFGFDAHGGTGAMTSASYDNTAGALTPDNWLITPAIDVTNASELIWWHDAQDPLWALEQYYVRVSTTGTAISDFTETLWDGTTPADWAEVTVDLSQFAGQTIYIAWNHTDVTDQFWMKIDDVTVTNTETKAAYTPIVANNSVTGYPFKTAGLNQTQIDEKLTAYNAIPNSSKALLGYNVYRDGGMIDFTTATSYDDMDLEDGTYEYYVTAVYDEGESEPSNSAFAVVFTASSTVFEYDFEDYTAGEQVACENPTEWTTWSNAPCGAEDAVISTDYALSGVNSFKVTGTNDLVKPLGALTLGHYKLSFNMYIPTGNLGYFNLLQDFAGASSQWGMQVYLGDDNAGPTPGIGWIDGGAALAANFTFDYDTWNLIEADIDLDQDWAEFYFNGELIHGYIWSQGTFGTGTLNQLDGVNFYAFAGVGGSPLYYIDDFMMEDVSVPPLPAPTNLVATVQNDFDVHLTWTAPVGGVGLQGYNIYRNAANIDFVAVPTTQYNDLDLSVGEYTYYVKAVFPGGESPASNSQTVEIINPQPLPPTNLVATAATSGTGIQLTWDGVGAGQWIKWDDGVNVDAIGLTGATGGTFSVASHWTAAELAQYSGFSIQKINFWPNEASATYTLKVWSGATGATELFSQNITTFTAGAFNEIVLSTPVLITGATDIWFGYTTTHPATTYPAGIDGGPAVQGSGDMIKLGTTAWQSLYTASGGTIDGNWNLHGYVGIVDGESSPMQPIAEVSTPVIDYSATFQSATQNGIVIVPSAKFVPNSSKDFMYNVYHKMQGGTYALLAGPMSETTYLHEYPGQGLHFYVVRTIVDGVESENSNEDSFLWTSVEEMVFDKTQVYPNPANGVVNIKSDFDIKSVKVFNHAGQTIANESVDSKFYQFNTSQFAPGIYMFQIETNEGTITKRIIVE